MIDTTDYCLSDLIAIDELRAIVQAFFDATDIPVTLLDKECNCLVALGWQDICANFHRANPDSSKNCTQSDRYIEQHLHEGNFVAYECLNGLVDVAFPIIVDKEHLGTFFIGQFLHHPPDKNFFRKQAERYGYDIHAYLEALEKVEVLSKERVKILMNFFMRLISLITRLSQENLARKRAEKKVQELNQSLEQTVLERTRELHSAMEKLNELAIHDSLTNIFNRRHFELALTQEVARGKRHGRALSLIMFDLDYFKQINDTFGHVFGDEVLKVSAAAAQCCIRQNDLLARWGGEEFMIILPETSLQSAVQIAERIRKSVFFF